MSLAPLNPTSFEYYLANAFSNKPFGGNPAVVAFLDPKATPTDVLFNIAATFKQPMTAFLSKDTSFNGDANTERFAVRYFTAEHEAHICLHATLAAAKVIFQTGRVGKEVNLVEFVTKSGEVLMARIVTREKNEQWIELELAKAEIVRVEGAEEKRIADIVNDYFGKHLTIHHVAKGVEPYQNYLLIEVDEIDNIGNCDVHGTELGKQTGFNINAITARSSTGNEDFVSRVFVPFESLGGEDHVCGSAHALLGPYWVKKQGLTDGIEVKAAQVSRRGGDLRIFWVKGEPKLKMRGQGIAIANGTFSF
ncbi:hypothetical protein GYMLUDRAFT_280943 [Collybiopsis luxurians FD-317 M1]|nr:hypothetical protein GYMLUDRAFT_280943 [Collybiopsis luxurians FD-317 M1]